MKKRLIYLMALCTLFSCKSNNQKTIYKSASSGNINSLLVVIDNALWIGSVGDVLRENLGGEIYGLPQVEPQFDLRQVPTEVFSNFVRLNRIVIKIQISDVIGIKYYKDPYATPQKMAVISGPDRQTLIDLIQLNAPTLISSFKSFEFKEKQRRIDKALFNTSRIETALKIKLRFSSLYRVAKEKEDFFWIRRDTKTGSLNLLLYNLPMQNFKTPEAFSEHVIRKRDSIAKQYIPGPLKGNYMATETAYTPFCVLREAPNVTALEIRSLWKIEDAFMSGPFVNFCFVDKVNSRLFVAEGFVYAPSETKRDYMFELETMMRSISVQ